MIHHTTSLLQLNSSILPLLFRKIFLLGIAMHNINSLASNHHKWLGALEAMLKFDLNILVLTESNLILQQACFNLNKWLTCYDKSLPFTNLVLTKIMINTKDQV